MADGKKYTVKDPSSGRVVTFQWNGDADPTDADMEEVFASAGSAPAPQVNQSPEPISAVRDPNPIVNFGQEAYDAAKSGIERIGNAFRPYQTYPITQDPIGRTVEGAGRLGEAMLGLGGAASAPFAPAISRIPFLESIDKGIGSAIKSQPLFKGLQAYTQAKNIPEVAETAEEVMKQGMYGAATAGVAKTLPVAKQYRSTSLIKKGNVGINQSFPALSKELSRPYDTQNMRPYLAEAQKKSPVKIGNIEKGGERPSVARQLLEEKMPEIQQKIWAKQNKFIERNADVPIDVNRVVSNVESLRNTYTKNVEILKDQSILEYADRFKKIGKMTVREASEMLKSLNASLQEFYDKVAEKQVSAENAAKPIAEMHKAADGLRDAIANTLSSQGENVTAFKKLHSEYGSSVRLKSSVRRNVIESEQPKDPYFTPKSATVYPSQAGIAKEALDRTIGLYNTPDRLARRALNRYAKSDLSVPPEAQPYPRSNVQYRTNEFGDVIDNQGNVIGAEYPFRTNPSAEVYPNNAFSAYGGEFDPFGITKQQYEGVGLNRESIHTPLNPRPVTPADIARAENPYSPPPILLGQQAPRGLLPPSSGQPPFIGSGVVGSRPRGATERFVPQTPSGTPMTGSAVSKRIVEVPEHRAIIEKAGGSYAGTNSQGNMFYHDVNGGTNIVPKGASPEVIREMISRSNAQSKAVTPTTKMQSTPTGGGGKTSNIKPFHEFARQSQHMDVNPLVVQDGWIYQVSEAIKRGEKLPESVLRSNADIYFEMDGTPRYTKRGMRLYGKQKD